MNGDDREPISAELMVILLIGVILLLVTLIAILAAILFNQ